MTRDVGQSPTPLLPSIQVRIIRRAECSVHSQAPVIEHVRSNPAATARPIRPPNQPDSACSATIGRSVEL